MVDSSSSSNRLAFLDLFRGLAVFGMFDAHITGALVSPPPDPSRVHYFHNLLFNLPAPAFLFAAGISFGMAVPGRWTDYRAWSPRLRNRLTRLAEVFLLGYLLHVPYFSLRRTIFQSSPRQLATFLNMDVLQCIAAGAFFLLVLVWILPESRWFLRACLALTAFVALASPMIWAYPPALPWWLATYLTKRWGSNFPLFPYVGFLFAGAAWGYLFSEARGNGAIARFMKKSGILGLGVFLAGAILARLPLPAPYNNFWGASVQFFLLRAGLFASTLAFLSLAESRIASAVQFLVPLGKESLMVYIVHIVIVYGSLLNREWNLHTLIGRGIGFWEWLAVYALLTIAMVLLAQLWGWVKERSDWNLDRLEWAAAAGAAVIFIFR